MWHGVVCVVCVGMRGWVGVVEWGGRCRVWWVWCGVGGVGGGAVGMVDMLA